MKKIYKVSARIGGIFGKDDKEISVVATEYEVLKVTEKSIMGAPVIDGKADGNFKKRFPLDRLNKIERRDYGDAIYFFTDDVEKISKMVLIGFGDVEEKVQREREAIEARTKLIRRGIETAEKEGVKIKWQD